MWCSYFEDCTKWHRERQKKISLLSYINDAVCFFRHLFPVSCVFVCVGAVIVTGWCLSNLCLFVMNTNHFYLERTTNQFGIKLKHKSQKLSSWIDIYPLLLERYLLICHAIKIFFPGQPASGLSLTPHLPLHTLMPEQALTLDLMPSKLRWLFTALSIETQSCLC